ncbi:MAG: hypothetical protein LBK46_04495 [Oscillospiraceae bacterium]|jgi:hypothetical protein|nr:hypothetical protein [Oscillospiraceae bacterium]
MDANKNDGRIKTAIDNSLSYMHLSEARIQIILSEAKGEKPMKRKLSLVLVLVIVIMLVSVAALAAVLLWEDKAKEIKDIEMAQGYYAEWQSGDKINLVRILVEMGLIEKSGDVDELLDGKLSDKDAHSVADTLLVNLTGSRIENVSLVEITETLWGSVYTWTEEQAAWWQQNIYLREFDSIPLDREIYLVPDETAIPRQQAIDTAKQALLDAFELPGDYFDTANVTTAFFTTHEDTSIHYWEVILRIDGTPDYPNEISYCTLVDSKTGEITQNKTLGIPTPAERVAMRDYVPSSSYDAFETALEEMQDKYEPLPVDRLYKQFEYWTLEDKAEFSKNIVPLINEAVEQGDAEEIGYYWLAPASFVYGVPSADAITQDDAKEIADKAILDKFGISADILGLYQNVRVYYDITSPDTPLWKFLYGTLGVDSYDALPKNQQPILYKVEINAYTSDIVACYEMIRGTQFQSLDTYKTMY